jgi:eukaryotic-like serine/threonine-protein kinase
MPKPVSQLEVRQSGRFGRYLVGPRIGTGGMAVIHAALEEAHGGRRVVALKRMADVRAIDPVARRLFLREASIAMRIEHPNVVRAYEVGEAEGEPYIVMELLEGATLADLQRAARTRIPLPKALNIVVGALRGLHAAHELRGPTGEAVGLIHQDVSPQNLHVSFEGTTRILDFGVARLLSVDASRTDAVRGKACYLAPEQLQLGKITSRTDIFAIGIVLHELLTGVPLFPRSQAELAYSAILSGAFPTPRSICAEVPQEVDAVARRALAVSPSERFESADEMRRALLAAQERAGIPVIDVADVGAWVQRVASPTWTKAGLEHDLHEAASAPVDASPDLSTLPPRRVVLQPRTLGRDRSRRVVVLGFGAGLIAAGSGWLVVHGGLPRETAAAATVSTGATFVAVASAAGPSRELAADPPASTPSQPASAPSAIAGGDAARSVLSGAPPKRPQRKVISAVAPMPSSLAPASPSSDPLATQ